MEEQAMKSLAIISQLKQSINTHILKYPSIAGKASLYTFLHSLISI